MQKFLALGISPELCAALKNQGITDPTPVQEKVIPLILNRKDVIAQAQTGTGKTFAFILPILKMINPEKDHIQALIITPTRELALQITTEIKKIIKNLPGVNVLAVYGGQDVERQMQRLKGHRQIVVGTPGRLLDHLRRGSINLTKASMLVLDEADQMLHMGFLAEVEDLIQNVPAKRQTMLFSATIPQQIAKLAANYMRKPEQVRILGNQITLDEIKQIIVETTDRAKQATLFALLDQHRPYLALIFCRTKRRANVLNAALQENGYDSEELHGDLSQAKREQVMKRFREAKIQFLVATDIAARGLDVEGVSHIYNYDIPQDAGSYIHRIGRTGRAGGDGLAVTFVAQNDYKYLELIEKGIKASIKTEKNEAFRGSKKAIGEKKPSKKKEEDGRSGGKGDFKGHKSEKVKSKKEGWAKKRKTDKKRPGKGKPKDKFKSDREKPTDRGKTEKGHTGKAKPNRGKLGFKGSSKPGRSK